MTKCRYLGKQMPTAAELSATKISSSVDLISEILIKLPVKSLLRFKCVCKSWLATIKTGHFIKMRLKHHSDPKNECILVVRNGRDETRGYLSFHSPETLDRITSLRPLKIPHLKFSSLDVCGPCNGLICASDDIDIVLCNPSTREYKLLPRSPYLISPELRRYHKRLSVGFVFDSHNNDFKVVRFVVDDEFLEIYSLSTSSWKKAHLKNFPQHVYPGRNGTLYEGSFYWDAKKKDKSCIISYNMSKDKFIYMSLPYRRLEFRGCIRVINDCLAVLFYDKKEPIYVEVWVLHGYGVERTFTRDFWIGPFTEIWKHLSIWNNETLLMNTKHGQLASSFALLNNHQLIKYNINAVILQTMVYHQSLVSINNR